jgi:transcriptional regulator with XRE-family HTH domain
LTPFGAKMRELRSSRGVTQKEMARAIGVSPAYLSALEHRRGTPTWPMIQKVIGYFNVIWDDAEEMKSLAETSHPRVVIDTSGLSPAATELANLLAVRIAALGEDELQTLIARLKPPRAGP